MTVCFYSIVTPEGLTYPTAVQNVDDVKLLKDGYFTVMLDGCYRSSYVDIFWDEDDVDWVAEPLRMCYVLQIGKTLFFQLRQ